MVPVERGNLHPLDVEEIPQAFKNLNHLADFLARLPEQHRLSSAPVAAARGRRLPLPRDHDIGEFEDECKNPAHLEF